MAAANASIGVAKAAFFPTIQLNGLAGLESLHAGSLFDWQSRFWSIGPSLTMPLFDAGQNNANLRLARATYQENVANYRETVLTAFADVEDNLAAQDLLASQTDAEDGGAARRAQTIQDRGLSVSRWVWSPFWMWRPRRARRWVSSAPRATSRPATRRRRGAGEIPRRRLARPQRRAALRSCSESVRRRESVTGHEKAPAGGSGPTKGCRNRRKL
jgi:hypothetical protein